MVKNLPAIQETGFDSRVSPGEGSAIPSGSLAWRISGTEEPGVLESPGLQRVGQE